MTGVTMVTSVPRVMRVTRVNRVIRLAIVTGVTNDQGDQGDKGDMTSDQGDKGDQGDEGKQREVSTIMLGLLVSSGFRKYGTLLVIQLFSRRLCLCLCLCIRLCLCICVPYSFLNSYYHKLSENVWVWGSVASRSGDVTIAGRTDERTNEQGKIELLSQWTMDGRDEQKHYFWHLWVKCFHGQSGVPFP